MRDWVRGAFCPNCNRLIYRLTQQDSSREWTQQGAAVQTDVRGAYVLCKSCSSRVRLKPTSELPGWGFEVDR